MPIEILMPALSPTMTEGTIAKWVKKEGDSVKSGDVLAEIETDKATMEVEAVDEGVVGKILIPEGTAGVKVNEPIALLLEEGEDSSALAKGPGKPVPAPQAPVSQTAASQAAAAPAAASAPAAAPQPAAPQSGAPKTGGRVFASPLARRMAEQAGLDLSGIAGSGPGGRVVKADIEQARQGGGAKPAAAPAAQPVAAAPAPQAAKSAPPAVATEYELKPHTSMRKVIAKRLLESKQTVPHFYLTVDICLDPLLKLRTELNARGEKAGVKLSVNDMVIKAAAVALARKPEVNAAWSDEGVMMFKSVDISVAVATDGGLITPIIKHADQKGFGTISAEMKDLAARAKTGKLKLEEFQGGTFSISNLGMFGVREFAAIINPPQSCILAVGAGEQRAVVKDGALAIQTMMSCTLSVDHRVVDGALGAQWLQVFKGLMEDPLSMML